MTHPASALKGTPARAGLDSSAHTFSPYQGQHDVQGHCGEDGERRKRGLTSQVVGGRRESFQLAGQLSTLDEFRGFINLNTITYNILKLSKLLTSLNLSAKGGKTRREIPVKSRRLVQF